MSCPDVHILIATVTVAIGSLKHIVIYMQSQQSVSMALIMLYSVACFYFFLFFYFLSERKKSESNSKCEQSLVIWIREK